MLRQQALGQLADHEPALHAEQQRPEGAEHAGHPGHGVGARLAAGAAGGARAEEAGEGRAGQRVSDVAAFAALGGEVGEFPLEADGELLEDGPERHQGLVGPLGPAEESERPAGRRFARLGQDPLLGRRGDLGEAGPVGGGDGRLALALEGHPAGDLAGDLPVDRPVRLEESEHLAEIEPPEGTQRLRGIAHAASLWA